MNNFYWEDNCCAPLILFQPCVGDFMHNYRTLALIIKKGHHFFSLSDKSWNIIRCGISHIYGHCKIKSFDWYIFCRNFSVDNTSGVLVSINLFPKWDFSPDWVMSDVECVVPTVSSPIVRTLVSNWGLLSLVYNISQTDEDTKPQITFCKAQIFGSHFQQFQQFHSCRAPILLTTLYCGQWNITQ